MRYIIIFPLLRSHSKSTFCSLPCLARPHTRDAALAGLVSYYNKEANKAAFLFLFYLLLFSLIIGNKKSVLSVLISR